MTVYDFVANIVLELNTCPCLNSKLKDYSVILERINNDLSENEITILLDCTANTSLGHFSDYGDLLERSRAMLRNDNFFMVFRWLESVDAITEKINNHFENISGRGNYVLNSVGCDKVVILPKVKRKIAWGKHIGEEFSDNINQLFKNLLVVNLNALYNFTVINHYAHELSEKKVKIIGSPVSDKIVIMSVEGEVDGLRCFTPNVKHGDASSFIETVVENLRSWDRDGYVLAAFPELISTKECNDSIISELSSIYFENIRYIALPTYYDFEEKQNVGDVYDTCSHKVLFKQYKAIPFIDYKSRRRENILGTKEIHLLHIPYLGIIAFPICRDILEEGYARFCREMHVSLAIVRACTSEGGIGYFKRIAGQLFSFASWVFVVNSCCFPDSSQGSKEHLTRGTIGLMGDCRLAKFEVLNCQNNCNACEVGIVL